MNTLIKATVVAIALSAGVVSAQANDSDRVLQISNGSGLVDVSK